jgi:hypothetical protein
MKRWPLSIMVGLLLLLATVAAAADGLTNSQINLLNNSSPAAKKVALGTKLDLALRGGTPAASAVTVADAGGHYTAEQVEAALTEVMTRLKAETDSASGADLVAATPISGIGTANTDTVQEILEGLDALLKSTTNGAAGADYVGATAIAGLSGETVQALLESLKSGLDAVAGPVYQFSWAGNMGHDVGAGSDGVLVGELTPQAIGYGFLYDECLQTGVLAYADDGGAYTDESTAANEATGNDVTLVPATAVQEDAYYLGHATKQFNRAVITITTAGNFVGTVTWEYWSGAAFVALANVADGTTNFSAGAADVSVTYDTPVDWEKCTVDGVNGYWIRGRLSAVTSGGGHKAGRVRLEAVAADAVWTDDTTDINSAGAGDVALLSTYPLVDNSFSFGADAPFCKLKVTISQARAAGTLAWEYWSGAAWATLTTQDNSATWSTGASTYIISWVPPADWAANTVNSQEAYWVRCRVTAAGGSQQPLATQGWLMDMTTGSGIAVNGAFTAGRVQMRCQTKSGTTADSKFLLVNMTQGTWDDFTWTKADVTDSDTVSLAFAGDDELAIVQVIEDGSTEFANTQLFVEP